ncbi:MAG: cyclic nucleotide-binding domain-containing protein [Deltaproteobacteria bacterium]|nr:cyclic nucleotide-binding domain-containing protein [Deltaproteobacteria bacterium]
MTTTATDSELLEAADLAFARGELPEALGYYVALLEADPSDFYVWYRTALGLGRLGERDEAAQALARIVAALSGAGQLLLALAAVKELQSLDEAAGGRAVAALAKDFGGTTRKDAGRPPPPPPAGPPRTIAVGEAVSRDPRVLRESASDACARALRAFEASSSKGHAGGATHFALFSELSPKDLAEVFPLMALRALPPGEVVIEQGADGTSFFVLVRGVVEVTRDGVHLAFLRSGAFFGEMALLSDSPRAARVVCHSPTLLFELDRQGVVTLAERSPGVAHVLASHTRERMVRNLLATSPLFAMLDPERREDLVSHFVSLVFAPGEQVLAEGEEGEGLYVVLSGEVEVSKVEGGEALALAHLGTGQVFGEISLLQRRPATATVTACRKTVVLCLPRESFNACVAEFPEVLAHAYRLAMEREQATTAAAAGPSVPVEDGLLI